MANRLKIIQPIALFFMLIILPAGSWYYLDKGLDYQINARAELKDYGKLPLQAATSITATKVNQELLNENIAVFNFLDTEKDINAQMTLLKRLDRQFQDEKVVFLTYDLQGNMTAVKEMAKELKLLTDTNVFFMDVTKEEVLYLIQTFQKPDIEKGKDTNGKYDLSPIAEAIDQYPYFILTDTALQIRNYYDCENEEQVKRLVEHLAMIMPREKQMKPEIYREKEK